MGSRVRFRLFHILHFMRDLSFPLLKNSKSGVDDRGHRLRITHTRRERYVVLFPYDIIEMTGSLAVIQGRSWSLR